MTLINGKNLQDELNRAMPALRDAKLGNFVVALLASHNQLLADHNALVAKHTLLLQHLDTGNVAGIGNANNATYGVPASTAVVVPALGN